MDVETIIKNSPVKLSDKDIKALRDGSEELEYQTWEEVKSAIAAGETGRLRRSPRDLRNYIVWHAEIGKTHGSVVEYVRRERLHWPDPIIARNAKPFAHPDDWKGEDLVWFKQKTESQSVKALEHIHVMLRNVPEERVEKLIGQQRSQTLQVLVGNSIVGTKT